ncbi:hypothetical protein VIBNISOn1_1390030 [Vibrio nigripulchritudo SOn1]|uniref:Uncharacterized protein n=1 Tax=Vibrio nigripulchritudo SOn1 TaxID=1238450 RepID=A0AAV2VKY2_9VIBR|nr:hypothetical protein VIBNISOn1_1390030 [Vibrio nigripulchritudo SOn1]
MDGQPFSVCLCHLNGTGEAALNAATTHEIRYTITTRMLSSIIEFIEMKFV